MRKQCPRCGSLKDAAKHFGIDYRRNNDGEFTGDGYQRYCKACRQAASKAAKQKSKVGRTTLMAHYSEPAHYFDPARYIVGFDPGKEVREVTIASTGNGIANPYKKMFDEAPIPTDKETLTDLYRQTCKDTASRSVALMTARLTKRWEKGTRWTEDYKLLSQ